MQPLQVHELRSRSYFIYLGRFIVSDPSFPVLLEVDGWVFECLAAKEIGRIT